MRMPFIAMLLAVPFAAAQAQDSTKYQIHVKDSMQATTSVTPMPLNDTTLLSRMHATNQMEIRLGQLAQRNGASATVKQYGARLVRDHSAADARVTALAKKLGITLMDRHGWEQSRGRAHDTTDYRNQPMRTDSMRPDSIKMQHDSMGRM